MKTGSDESFVEYSKHRLVREGGEDLPEALMRTMSLVLIADALQRIAGVLDYWEERSA